MWGYEFEQVYNLEFNNFNDNFVKKFVILSEGMNKIMKIQNMKIKKWYNYNLTHSIEEESTENDGKVNFSIISVIYGY